MLLHLAQFAPFAPFCLVPPFPPKNLSFRIEGQINCFPDKVKLKEFIITKSLLYETLKEPIEEKDQN